MDPPPSSPPFVPSPSRSAPRGAALASCPGAGRRGGRPRPLALFALVLAAALAGAGLPRGVRAVPPALPQAGGALPDAFAPVPGFAGVGEARAVAVAADGRVAVGDASGAWLARPPAAARRVLRRGPVHGLAFDARGYRLGYGGGFYDRTLERLRADGRILAIGLAFDAQNVPALPAESTDQPLDAIVTETGLRRF